MFKTYIKRSKYIELISEETDESATQHKILFRVTDLPAWSSALVELLRFAEDEEDYLVSIRKEYLLKDGSPSFMWVMMVYGNIESAATDLGPLLCDPNKKVSVPTAAPEAPTAAATATSAQTSIKARTIMTDDGVRVIKEVPLPFRRGMRDKPAQEITKKFGDQRKGAYVTTAVGAEL